MLDPMWGSVFVKHGWCMKRDLHMSHNLLNQVPWCEGGDAEAGICSYETTHAMLGQRSSFTSYQEAAEGQGFSLLWPWKHTQCCTLRLDHHWIAPGESEELQGDIWTCTPLQGCCNLLRWYPNSQQNCCRTCQQSPVCHPPVSWECCTLLQPKKVRFW